MQGSIKQRSKGSWTLRFDAGYGVDPNTGRRRRRQMCETFRGTKRDAQNRLTELLRAQNRGELVEKSKLTVGEWLTEWLEKAVKPPAKRINTYRTYKRIITKKLVPALGAIRLQELKAADLKHYYSSQAATLSSTTLSQYHTLISSALKAATLEGLLIRNVASIVVGKPQIRRDHSDVSGNCWEADEAQKFLVAAKAEGARPAAFHSLALDSGARRGELCGLQWGDLDFDKGTVTFVRQLIETDDTGAPVFGLIKNDMPRTVDLSAETVALLKEHKRHQAELKMANRTIYKDHSLVFAKEWGERRNQRKDFLGLPLQANNLGEREFARIAKAANVKRISIHGLRHTSATLLLKAGVAPHVVQQRLGHKRIEMTLGIYAHALPSMQQDAARRLGSLLYGFVNKS
jgi:integrase